tara:strand:+ start:203 stop:676 length:474 start_codon:yes stop_codon:yes gene_type:complete
MNSKYLNIYNNLIQLTRNKSLYVNYTDKETFSDRLTMFFLHFAFFLKTYKNKSSKKNIQNLYDFIFKQIELSIREIGYGDASINKKMKDYVNLMHFIINKIDSWDLMKINEKSAFFTKLIDVDKQSTFYVDYFTKYSFYLSKKPFNYFTKEVINHKF